MLEGGGGDLLDLATIVPVGAVVIAQPEYQVLVLEEQLLEHEAPVKSGKVGPYLVE